MDVHMGLDRKHRRFLQRHCHVAVKHWDAVMGETLHRQVPTQPKRVSSRERSTYLLQLFEPKATVRTCPDFPSRRWDDCTKEWTRPTARHSRRAGHGS